MILSVTLKKNFNFILKFEDDKQLRFSCRRYRDYTFINTQIGTIMLHVDLDTFLSWLDSDTPTLYVDNGLKEGVYMPSLIKIKKSL